MTSTKLSFSNMVLHKWRILVYLLFVLSSNPAFSIIGTKVPGPACVNILTIYLALAEFTVSFNDISWAFLKFNDFDNSLQQPHGKTSPSGIITNARSLKRHVGGICSTKKIPPSARLYFARPMGVTFWLSVTTSKRSWESRPFRASPIRCFLVVEI